MSRNLNCSLCGLALAALVVAGLTSSFMPQARLEATSDLAAETGVFVHAVVFDGAPLPPIERPELATEGELISPFARASQAPHSLLNRPDRYWAKNHVATMLWSSPAGNAPAYVALPQWTLLEHTGQQESGRMFVHTPGDGRALPPRSGWVTAVDVMVSASPSELAVPRAYPSTVQAGTLRLHVPYRSQIDGTPWEAANCGPTALAMVLDAIGTNASSGEIRRQVLDAQGLWGDDVGVLMEALAEVGERRGARILNYTEGGIVKRWSLDDVRTEIRAGRPVVLQVRFRGLPGREDSLYWGDHFVVITGLVGETFIYNDPIDSDGLGYDRIMTAAELWRAMDASDRRYANAGFAVAKR